MAGIQRQLACEALPVEVGTVVGASAASKDFLQVSAHGIEIVIRTTAVTGTTPTLTVELKGKDPQSKVASGGAVGSAEYYSLTTQMITATINATGITVIRCYPGITAVANKAVNDFVPSTWRLEYVTGGTNPSFTINVSATYFA